MFAGDTHNAWASELTDNDGNNIGCELATSSVTSPGLEYYLGLTDETALATEAGLVSLIDTLKYTNLTDRGFLTVTFTQQETQATWHFVDTILSTQYTELSSRQQSASIAYGAATLVLNETSS